MSWRPHLGKTNRWCNESAAKKVRWALPGRRRNCGCIHTQPQAPAGIQVVELCSHVPIGQPERDFSRSGPERADIGHPSPR
jgi:hypothetical protein